MKSTSKILILILLMTPFLTYSQYVDWGKQFGQDNNQFLKSMVKDSNGNIYVLGETGQKVTDLDPGPSVYNLSHTDFTSGYDVDAFLVKLDNNGNFLWGKGLATKFSNSNQAHMLKIGPDNSVYTLISMYDYPYKNSSLIIKKFDTEGNLLLTKKLNNENGQSNSLFGSNSLNVDSQGNMYIGGYFMNNISFEPQNPQFDFQYEGVGSFIVKLDPTANIVWTKTITDNEKFFSFRKFILHPDGNLNFLSGKSVQNATQTGYDPLQTLYKVDTTTGTTLWQKDFLNTYPQDFQIAPNGEMIILSSVGMGTFDVDPGPGEEIITTTEFSNKYSLWLNENGEFNNVELYPAEWSAFPISGVFIDSNNNYYFTGNYNYDADLDFDLSENEFHINESYANVHTVIMKYDSNYNFNNAFAFRTGDGVGICDIISDGEKLYIAGTVVGGGDFQPGEGEFIIDTTYNGVSAADGYVIKLGSSIMNIPEEKHNKLLIYPNPASDKITLVLDELTEKKEVLLINSLGVQLYNSYIEKTLDLDISHLPAGIYFLKIKGDDIYQKKIIKY